MNRTTSWAVGLGVMLGMAGPAVAAEWHHPLYLDGGGYWRQRLAVVVRNESSGALDGQPVAVSIGRAPGAAALVGASAESVRVCDPQGEERYFAIADSSGRLQTRGTIAAGSTLTIPVECPPQKSADYYVYFDNPSAGELPDFLPVRSGFSNGDVEQGTGPAPEGWQHDEPDAQHRTLWVDERPQSGRRCLKTVVDEGSEPSWIATRQTEILIRPGARYVMKAWVRGERVNGIAGWYIHVGNRSNPILVNPILGGGQGTFDWKLVGAEFTAPADADLADLGTVLRGTGTAWFDNVTLTCLEPAKTLVRIAAGKPERLAVRESADDTGWPSAAASHPAFQDRAVVKVTHLGSQGSGRSLAGVDVTRLVGRSRGRLDKSSIQVRAAGKTVPSFFCGNLLLFPAQAAARTVQTYHVYFSSRDAATSSTPELFNAAGTDRNLVRNPGFERGQSRPEGWTSVGASPSDGIALGVDDPRIPGLGRHSAKMVVPATASTGWRGWNQDVPVRAGHSYLVAAEVKCEDVKEGEVRVHVHLRKSDGQLCAQEAMTSIGPPIQGTTGWTLMSGMLRMPQDAATLQLHLTMDRKGTVWHDSVLVAEVLPATFIGIEHRPSPSTEPLNVWPVPSIIKLFPDEPPPSKAAAVRIAAARLEKESLQLAVRANKALRGVRIEVDSPVGPRGARLSAPEVGFVGFVPIDHPTSYYQSQTPAWHRKYPNGGGQSDGWAGSWPDPILPRSRLDLARDATQPVWITVAVGGDAPAGDYQGAVRFVGDDGQRLAVVPFTVHVWDYALPERSRLKAIYDIGLGPGAERFWGKSTAQAYPEIAAFMGRNRISPNRILPDPGFTYKHGKAGADFRAFDAAAHQYFDEWKLPHSYMPWFFYEFGWGFPPKDIFDEHPYPGVPPFEKADRSTLRPEYRRAYQACLKLFWDHVKEKGWQDRFVLYISDEPFYLEAPIRAQMKALCAMIHEVDPKIPIYSSTWHHVPDWDGSLDIWGIGHYGVVPPETIAKIRQGGAKIWFTTDGQMCTDTPYCAVERLLPYYCFHHGAEAYEFWGVAWLTYDPYRFGWHAYIHQTDAPGKSYWVRYPNGDGFLLYPGASAGVSGPVSSIRFEQAREGLEDYEALRLLRDLAAKAKAAHRDTTQADHALEAAENLVPIPNAGGRFSTQVLPDPEAVDRVREAVSRAIEDLAGRG